MKRLSVLSLVLVLAGLPLGWVLRRQRGARTAG